MIDPLVPPRRKDPLRRTRQPTLPPAERSRKAHGLIRPAAEGRFMLPRCRECGTFHYPPREACPKCLSFDVKLAEAPAGGVLASETTIRVPSEVYFRERAPWRIGIVTLDCGPSMVAHLHADCTLGERVMLSLQLDRSGQAVAFAHPATRTPNMADDPQWRELTADPKFRRVLVTDARGPVGLAAIKALKAAGAGTVFAGVSEQWKPFPGEAELRALEGATIVPLDVRDDKSVHDLASDIGAKVDILINTAAHIRPGGVLERSGLNVLREELETGYLGLVRLAQAFGPVMRARGADGVNSAAAWVNILSVYALANLPAYGAYSASQAACLSLGQSLRTALRPGGIKVVNIFTGPLDIEWFQTEPPPKVAPAALARAIVDALRRGLEDVFVGDVAQDIHARFLADPKALERELAG
ncbi:SDR family NAD(P)-dependent oxidoreductase [Pseudochelatococcus sp. B33]